MGRAADRRRAALWDEVVGAGDTALTLGSGALGEITGGWGGLLSGDPGAVEAIRDEMTWRPRTAEGARNLGWLGDAMAAVGDTPLAPSNARTPGGYRPATLGEAGAEGARQWEEGAVPWLQDTLGEKVGSGVAALGLGALQAGLPAGPRNAGHAQRLSKRLLEGDMDPKRYTRAMEKAGYLSPEEAASLPRGRAKGIAEKMAASPGMNANQLAEAALAGWPKRGWYRDSAKAVQDIFGDDSKRFAYLLSALSPQTSVESNLKNAVAVWSNWKKAGGPTDKASILRIMGESVEGNKGEKSVLDAWQNNAFRALSADNMDDIRFSGPKVSSFARNLVGELGEVTNDAWMAKAMDVDQDIFSGQTSKAAGADQFGEIGGQGAGYQAANAVVREAADVLTKRFADQGIEVTPAEVQEMVWSYAKPLWEARDAEGNLRPMNELMTEGVLTDEMIQGTPDFGTLLSETPEYRASLEGVGHTFDNLQLPEPHAARPAAPDPKLLNQFNTRIENRYRRDTIPAEMKRTVGSILAGNPQYTSPGDLRRPGYTRGVGGRTIRPVDARRERMDSLGMDTRGFLQLEPGEAGGALFQDYMRDATQAHKFGDSVDIHDIEKYANSDLYLAPGGAGGFALDNGNMISAFSHPQLKRPGFSDNLLLAGVNQGGRYLDAFDTRLPSLYARAGFKPTSRMAFDPAQLDNPELWDYEKYGAFNAGRPDIMTMALDPKNAELLPMTSKPYAKQSKKAKKARQGLLTDNYDTFLQMQQDEVGRLGALYPGY